MFRNAPLAIKLIAIINTIINLLLLLPLFIFVRIFYPSLFILGLLVVIANIILGIQIVFFKNWARVGFIIMQSVGLFLSIHPFLCILTLGMNGGSFGDGCIVPWSPFNTPMFWKQIAFFIVGMSFPSVPMLFSIYCIIYLKLPMVKDKFK